MNVIGQNQTVVKGKVRVRRNGRDEAPRVSAPEPVVPSPAEPFPEPAPDGPPLPDPNPVPVPVPVPDPGPPPSPIPTPDPGPVPSPAPQMEHDGSVTVSSSTRLTRSPSSATSVHPEGGRSRVVTSGVRSSSRTSGLFPDRRPVGERMAAWVKGHQ